MTISDELRLARALFQFIIYLEALRVPFTLRDLYVIAYGDLWHEMPGGLWLDYLHEDEYVVQARHEFYTLYTVFETMHDNGLILLLDVIREETARLGIHMGVITPGRYRPRPPQGGEDA